MSGRYAYNTGCVTHRLCVLIIVCANGQYTDAQLTVDWAHVAHHITRETE